MVVALRISPGEHVPTADQRVVMHGVPWAHFEAMLAVRGDAPVPRIAYVEGALELMSPSKDHERIKSYLGSLIEAYALERSIELSRYGSWTLKNARAEGSIEPDECFILGLDQTKERPDLAIEVVWTSGGIDKLEAYRRLGVAEVWFWRADVITVHLLVGGRYEPRDASTCLPGLDLQMVCALLDRPTVTQAVRGLRDALRAG